MAGTVYFPGANPNGEELPDDLATLMSQSSYGPGGIIVAGFFGANWLSVDPSNSRTIEIAIEQADAKTLNALNTEWAPFYCPACEAAYCKDHWILQLQFDDDDPGWYDCTYGTCPKGHRYMLDD